MGSCINLFARGFCGCCVEVELIVGVGLVGLGRIGSIRSEQEVKQALLYFINFNAEW